MEISSKYGDQIVWPSGQYIGSPFYRLFVRRNREAVAA